MDVLASAFSSAARPKSHYRGRRLEAVTQPEEAGVRAQNETLLLLNLLAYELLHAGRCVMEQTTGTGWSLRRLRERVLRVASRVVRHGRRLTFVIAQDAAADCARLGAKLTLKRHSYWLARACCYGPYHVRLIRYVAPRIVRRGRSRPADRSTSAPADHKRRPSSALSRSAHETASNPQFSQLSR